MWRQRSRAASYRGIADGTGGRLVNTLNALYARSESGLMVPRTAMQPAAAPAPARHVISRQQRRWLERHGVERHCSTCSRVISMNAENPQCGECRQKGEAFRARAAAAGLLLPE